MRHRILISRAQNSGGGRPTLELSVAPDPAAPRPAVRRPDPGLGDTIG